jgi:hypothetical protein
MIRSVTSYERGADFYLLQCKGLRFALFLGLFFAACDSRPVAPIDHDEDAAAEAGPADAATPDAPEDAGDSAPADTGAPDAPVDAADSGPADAADSG